jgi:hypothetical protein
MLLLDYLLLYFPVYELYAVLAMVLGLLCSPALYICNLYTCNPNQYIVSHYSTSINYS